MSRIVVPERDLVGQSTTGSRHTGQVMQWPPPRPRPSSGSVDLQHRDTSLAQPRVGPLVAVVGDDHTGLQGNHVVAVVPLLARLDEGVTAGGDGAEPGQAQRLGNGLDPTLLLDGDVESPLLGR